MLNPKNATGSESDVREPRYRRLSPHDALSTRRSTVELYVNEFTVVSTCAAMSTLAIHKV